MSASPPPLIRAHAISKWFGHKAVLERASLSVAAGEAVALVGENGAGKTTLLRVSAGLIESDRGEVSAAGRIGYCPQEPGVLDLLTADEHLAFFGTGMDIPRPRALREGRALLEEFGFPLEERTVARDLSGGTRQKLNLALALLGDPPILLLDEPYQGFDLGTYVNFWDHVDRWRGRGKAIVIVTHMLAELSRVDRVIELKVHPSRAVQPHGTGGG
jgi:ABC-type multidrug transport system ATPase subunit